MRWFGFEYKASEGYFYNINVTPAPDNIAQLSQNYVVLKNYRVVLLNPVP